MFEHVVATWRQIENALPIRSDTSADQGVETAGIDDQVEGPVRCIREEITDDEFDVDAFFTCAYLRHGDGFGKEIESRHPKDRARKARRKTGPHRTRYRAPWRRFDLPDGCLRYFGRL